MEKVMSALRPGLCGDNLRPTTNRLPQKSLRGRQSKWEGWWKNDEHLL